jgi:hypothetical protein
MEAADFRGYATKAGLKCSDGRTITAQAFSHMDGMQVPLVWQHGHSDPENVLGHVLLHAREDGMYCEGFFNGTPKAQHIKSAVAHKDITNLSIYANALKEHASRVLHGVIREVSLVLSGANPGALIDFISVQHSDGDIQQLEDEAIIYTDQEIEHDDLEDDDDELEHAAGDNMTVQEVFDSLSPIQKNVVHYMIGVALEGTTATHSDTEGDTTEGTGSEGAGTEENTAEGDLTHQEGNTIVARNVFDQTDADKTAERHYLSHDAIKGIVDKAKKPGHTLRSAVEDYALAHGINDIDTLFPDPKLLTDRPEWDTRRMEWVRGVINGTSKTPFTRIKSIVADLTFEQARAKGYVKGNLKKEQFFGLTSRVTTPTTIYKKQKLDRDDIIDITDFDVVAWLKMEMRFMLEEEIARAILIGDGRDVADEDKIKDPIGATEGAGVRSILNDDDLYVSTVFVNIDDASSSYQEVIDAIIRARRLLKGTGQPTFYTTEVVVSNLLLLRDGNDRRYFHSLDEVANELRVAAVIPVEVMEDESDVLGILVNLADYSVGADKGGEISLFDDFDIDYNQYKYLIETRISGALTKIRSAQVVKKVASGAALVVPVEPGFDDNVITPATTTGVTYKRADTDATVTTGAPITLNSTTLTSLTIYAVPASASYYFANNVEDQWTFNYEA